MPRIPRIVLPNYPHHIIQRGNNRHQVFFDNKDRQNYLKLLGLFSKENHCKIYAYCLMVNHIHLLLEPGEKDSLAKLMQKLALCYTQYFNSKYKRTGRLWECRYHSSLIDKDSYMWAVIRYIETNPIKAEITERVEGYRWSSARTRLLGKDGKHIKLQRYFNEGELEDYKKSIYINQANAETYITKQTYYGRPIGNKKFLMGIGTKLGKDLIPKPRGRREGWRKVK